ncbi:hypothetical protein L228DRAFT_157423 [Xylona heveae TC161]|uniref:AA1-like domain-containing protein n=1 Tax=Xylona heveae (strain CBS 132557 / TC161) TaxID=1328760 RepID=A0A165G2Q5_XYLHT|nr:hypothetical protein L228DRAFT_157423 [Xylona heveae TC161]KZF21672.1 hypothetical protein L228DRAFT_157423 [Xylona heveae TC161]
MKLLLSTITLLLTTLTTSTLASPAPVAAANTGLIQRGQDGQDGQADQHHKFLITNFYDSGSPHSIEARVTFDVTDLSPPKHDLPVTNISNVACFASLAIQPTIAYAAFGTPCQAPGLSFGLQWVVGAGYYLSVVHSYDNNKTVDAGTVWLGSDVETYQDPFNPNGNYQYLNHSTTFEFKYNRVKA